MDNKSKEFDNKSKTFLVFHFHRILKKILILRFAKKKKTIVDKILSNITQLHKYIPQNPRIVNKYRIVVDKILQESEKNNKQTE